MKDSEFLALEIHHAVEGDPWYGPSAMAVLTGVDAATARARPAGAAHCIWQVVTHTTSWARHVAYRLAGGAPGDPADGDWPPMTSTDEAAWSEAVADLRRAHDELVSVVGAYPDDALGAITDETPVDDAGAPLTLRRAVSGVAQHCAYHCGQIAILKQTLAGEKSGSA